MTSMPDLYVTAAHPNPLGKDKPSRSAPTNDQLNEEWVEFNNPTEKTRDIAGVSLSHYTYDKYCKKTGEVSLPSFIGTLDPLHLIRIHSGSGENQTIGQRHHLYLGYLNFIWNNSCGDTVVIRGANGRLIDWAEYEPGPDDGRTLYRAPYTNQIR